MFRRRHREAARLHIGAGPQRLEGWVNIDLTPYPAVDAVLDVTRPLPYENVRFIFAEHFLEHLAFDDARAFLRECRRALASDGVLRLTTPNLSWVVATQYQPSRWSGDADAVADCFRMNRGFYGWGHQFLYNAETLTALLRDCGFGSVERAAPGVSEHPELRNLERHEQYEDAPDLPHVLVVEASGQIEASQTLATHAADYRRNTQAPWHMAQYAYLATVRAVSRLLRRR